MGLQDSLRSKDTTHNQYGRRRKTTNAMWSPVSPLHTKNKQINIIKVKTKKSWLQEPQGWQKRHTYKQVLFLALLIETFFSGIMIDKEDKLDTHH